MQVERYESLHSLALPYYACCQLVPCSQTLIHDFDQSEFLLKVNATRFLLHPYNSEMSCYAKRSMEKENQWLQNSYTKNTPKKYYGRLWQFLKLNHAFVCYFGLTQQELQSTQETPPFWIRRRFCNHKATSDWARTICLAILSEYTTRDFWYWNDTCYLVLTWSSQL